MLYIKCPTCKTLLGDKDIPFNTELDKIREDKNLTDEQKTKKTIELYDKFSIENYCCKMRFKTFIDQINIVK